MLKRKKMYLIFLSIFIIFLFVFVISINIKKTQQSNAIINFYNGEINEIDKQYFDNYLNYLNGKTIEELDITYAIKNYFNVLEKCIIAKINNEKLEFEKYYFDGEYGIPIIHGLTVEQATKIQNLISEEDINNYKNQSFFNDIMLSLENNEVLLHKSKNIYADWYINNHSNQTINMPFGVQLNFKCDILNRNSNFEEVTSIKLYKKNGYDLCDVKLKEKNGKILSLNEIQTFKYDDFNGLIFIPDLEKYIINVKQKATIDFYQNDFSIEYNNREKDLNDFLDGQESWGPKSIFDD